MGSLNGDIMVMRNGRSTSQISVYNYPEHLNPFYEDDQHKRLRFWKISKNENDGRRNSFSFGNLRDIWTFKSFRSKKKSSTLGITKTSESPPPLRRDFGAANNGWNTFDNRLRHSTASGMNGDNFQRNATYRSSLQTLPTNTDRIGLNRNDDYRSTIQVPRANPRYHPQPKTPQAAGLRSSMTSTGSTNPFDSDDDGDLADASAMRSINGGSTSTLSKSTPRKKRRAPAPPTPIHGRSPTICIDSSQNNAQGDELCIREDTDIAHLTAEIETFVKDKSNEDDEIIIKAENQTKNVQSVLKDEKASAVTTATVTAATTVTVTAATSETNSPANDEKKQITQKVEVKAPPPPKEIRKNAASLKTQSPMSVLSVTNDVTNVTNLNTDSLGKVQPEAASNELTSIQSTPKINSPTPLKRDIKNINTTISRSETVSNSQSSAHISPEKAPSTKPELPPKLHSPIKSTSNKGSTAALGTTSKVHTSSAATAVMSAPREDEHQVVHVKQTTKTSEINTPTETPHPNGSISTQIKSSRTTNSNIVDKPLPITPLSQCEPKTDVTDEHKSNGAIPKKLNNITHTAVSELCINESDGQEPQRPIPMKRVSKTDAEQGQVECIHVHVGSPRSTPREEHANRLSSFKKDQTRDDTEIITTKTPFILTSPPAQRKSVQEIKQSTEIGNAYVVPKANAYKVLNIQEDETNIESAKTPKPPLSPKPVMERNSQVHNFAEIHKPIRSKINQTANGHVKRVSHDDLSASPPTVPQKQLEAEKQPQPSQSNENVGAIENKQPQLVINETLSTMTTNQQKNNASSAQTSAPNSVPVGTTLCLSADTEAEALYRPKPTQHLEWKQSTLAPLEEHIPPEKRKSVKDIIESINRSQRLLQAAANKDFTIVTTLPAEPLEEPSSHQENLQMLEENQREIKRIIREIDEVSTAPPSYSECMEAHKLDNSEIFKKCKVNKEVYDYRETSPITSNLDWNPVPKPKRTKAPNE